MTTRHIPCRNPAALGKCQEVASGEAVLRYSNTQARSRPIIDHHLVRPKTSANDVMITCMCKIYRGQISQGEIDISLSGWANPPPQIIKISHRSIDPWRRSRLSLSLVLPRLQVVVLAHVLVLVQVVVIALVVLGGALIRVPLPLVVVAVNVFLGWARTRLTTLVRRARRRRRRFQH